MSSTKPDTTTRFLFHNVNGLCLRGSDGLDILLHELSVMQVDVQAISEHCLDTTKFQVLQTAHTITRQHREGRVLLKLDSSSEPSINQYKPGGTGIIAIGAITSKLEPQGRGGDTMGRWSYLHFRRKTLPPLTVISVYQVCPTPTNTIGNTAYHQQQRILNLAGRSGVHPRVAFQEDLGQFVSELLNKNHDILLGGDFNEGLTDRRSGVHKLATTYDLVDPFQYKHPHHDQFGTHIHGQRRIDLVLMTPRLLQSLIATGYSPFHYMTSSDHRQLILDFDTRTLFGTATTRIQELQNRALRSTDKKAVTQFINTMYDKISKRGGFRYRDAIDDDSAPPHIVETVDLIIGQSGDIAESRCKKRRPEFFSQPLVQQRIRVSILRGYLNSLRCQRDRSAQLYQRMQRLGVHVDLPPTQHLTRQALQTACARLQELIREHTSLRQEELAQKISSAAQANEKKRAKILRSIQKVEMGIQTYRVLRAMRSKGGNNQIDRIEVPASWPLPGAASLDLSQLEDPKTCQAWRTVLDPQELEFYLITRNRLHFGQAEHTPFTLPPLRDDFDWAASSPESEALLRGTYSMSNPLRQCDNLLRACQSVTAVDSLPAELTMDEFKGKIKSWREATSTSPSGRHLGRYKALFAAGCLEGPEDTSIGTSFRDKQQDIATLLLSVINYCIRNNHVLTRWKTIVNVMILKEPQNIKIHRLRVIHLYEADFNLILAVKWRQLLRHADALALLNDGQYGGRPGCEAQSLTLLEEFKYDISYLTRRSLIHFDNDATSCYDRIVVPLASIINRKYGLHRQVAALHGHTLQTATFRLKTSAGVSAASYSQSAAYPIHGTGQGSGNSPSIWTLLSSTLFDAHAQQAYGVSFVSPDGQRHVKMAMIGFVDDSTSSCNSFLPNNQPPLQTLFQHMTHDAQVWNDLLHCSGGKLELSKCSFHVLHFEYKPDGRPVPTLVCYNDNIHLRECETSIPIPIPAKRPFELHKTLGHYKSPTTSFKGPLTEITQKAYQLSLLISMSSITRQGALLAYQTVYLPAVKYTLPQSFYPCKLLDQAQAKSLSLIIAKSGFNRHTARAIMFAPVCFAGGGFIPWYVLQGEGQILHLLKHTRTDTIVSRTLRIAMEWAQWQSGHNRSIFQDTTTEFQYLECRWISSTRKFLASINATLSFDKPILYPGERHRDIHIMTYARECGLFSPKDLEIINYCRLYLHVTTVSELFESDGQSMIPMLFQCTREPWFNPSTYITLQQRPSLYQIRTKWQRLCREWVTSTGVIAASLSFGNWTVPGHALRRRRKSYLLHSPTLTLYHWYRDCYWQYIPTDRSRIFRRHAQTAWQPAPGCIPVAITTLDDTTVQLIQKVPPPPRRVTIPPPRSFEAYVQTLDPWEQDLLCGCHFKSAPFELQHLIERDVPNLLLVSDGSHRGQDISYGWVYGTEDGRILAEHSGDGYGHPNSFRAEAWGMLSGTLFLHHLHIFLGNPSGASTLSVAFLADNAGLIQRITRRRQYTTAYPNSTLDPEWDVTEQIYSTSLSLPFSNVTYAWVQGHQDATMSQLPVDARYNICADFLAGQVDFRYSPRSPTWILPSAKVRLMIQGTHITSNYVSAIRRAATVPPLMNYLRIRHSWSTRVQQHVDWKLFETACTRTSISQIQLCKLVYGKLPTRYELSKSNPHQDTTCPHCTQKDTFSHLLRCTNPISQKFRDELLEKVDHLFRCHTVSPLFRQLFFSSTAYWLEPSNPDLLETEIASPFYRDQAEIGWSLFPRGFFALSWVHTLHAVPMTTRASQHSPEIFLQRLVEMLWTAQLDLWNQYTANASVETTSQTLLRTHDKKQEYQRRIRQLHAQRNQCLHGHRDQYFYANVDSFLQEASISQMRSYLHHYEKPIQESIMQSSRDRIPSLFQFPGFSFTRRTTPQPIPVSRLRVPTSTNRLRASKQCHLTPTKHHPKQPRRQYTTQTHPVEAYPLISPEYPRLLPTYYTYTHLIPLYFVPRPIQPAIPLNPSCARVPNRSRLHANCPQIYPLNHSKTSQHLAVMVLSPASCGLAWPPCISSARGK